MPQSGSNRGSLLREVVVAPEQHVTVSIGSGVILGLLTRSWIAGTACCLIGILTDLDHILDFWLNRGLSLSISEFFEFNYRGTSKKFFDILHGYEFIPLLWYLATIPGWWHTGLGLALGYTIHLLCDQFFNRHLNRWTYFLTYRLYHRFESSRIILRNPFRDADLAKSHTRH